MLFIRYSSNLLKNYFNRHKPLNQLKCLSTLQTKQIKHKFLEKSVQNLVIDLSFEDLMTTEECHRLAKELYAIHCLNSSFDCIENKFNVNVCNKLSKNSITIEYLKRYLPQNQMIDDFQVHNESYLELFQHQRLVYLSPDAKDLIDFNSDDIYIIGGIVKKNLFKRDSNLITYNKAKRDGIRIGRFPIDHFISDQMKRGITLFLPQVFCILSDVKSSHDWESAVKRNLPFWKLNQTTRPISAS